MASRRRKTAAASVSTPATAAAAPPAIETQPVSPRAGQDPQQQCRRRLSSPLSRSRSPSPNPRRLSAPHSTVVTEEINDDDLLTSPSSPDDNRFGGSSATASTNRLDGTTSFEVDRRSCSSSNAVNDDDNDDSRRRSSCNNDGDEARKQKGVVVTVDSDVVSLRGGADVNVQATGAVVRWARKSSAGQQQQQQQQQLEEDSGGRREDRAEADGSRVGTNCSSSPTITFLADDTDDPPVTRQISCDGVPFRRPGRYTYIVSSGPLSVGRVVVSEAPNEADTDEEYSGRAVAVDNDVDYDPAVAASSLITGPSAKPEKVLAAAADGGATPAGASQACAPPEEEEADREGRPADGSERGRSDNGDGGHATGSQGTTKNQQSTDEQQQQQQQQQNEQEEEEEAMAADELSPVHARKLPKPLDGLGESSAFSSPLENAAPWQGDRAATETAEHSYETPMREEVAAGLPGPLSLLLVPPCKPPLALSTCGDDANDCGDGTAVTNSECFVEQNGSLAPPSLIAPPPSLGVEGGGQMPRRGIGEGTTVSPMTEALPEDCEGRDSPIECLVQVEGGRPTSSSPTEEVVEDEVEKEAEGAEVAVKEGGQKEREGRESLESEDGDRGGDGESDPADHGYGGGGENKGGRSVIYSSSSSSKAGESMTPQTSLPAASATSGVCKEEDGTIVASFRPVGDDAEPDPQGEELVVEMEEPRREATAVGVACEGATETSIPPSRLSRLLSPTSWPLERAETTVLAHSSGSGFTGGVGEINCDDEPDDVLSDNSCVDSDDGTAATSQSAKGGECEDKRPSSPPPLSPEPTSSSLAATDGFGGGGGESSYLAGAVLEPGVPQFSPSFQIEPVPNSGRAEKSQGDGGVTRQEWRDGMSPLTSPAVGERLGGDDRSGFGCSEGAATVFSSRAVASDDASEDGQQLSAFKVDGGLDNGEKEREQAVCSTAERAGMVESAAATILLETNDDDNDDDGTLVVVKVISGDSSRKSFDPEKARVPVGATVVWELHGGVMPGGNDNGAGPVCETFHVREDIPMYDNGFVTECTFSLRGAQPSFAHTFKQEGLFIMCSKTSASDDGKKRGEIFVYGTTSEDNKKRGENLMERAESLSHSQGDSTSFDPDSVSADFEGFPSGNEDNSGSHASSEHDNQRSAATRSDVSQSNSPSVPNCPVGDERSRSNDTRGARATPSTEHDEALRGFSATGVPARHSVGTTAPPQLRMDKAILAATAAATVGQAKSVAESLRISSVGRYRGLPPLVGVHSTGGGGGRIDIGDGPGWPPGGVSVLGRANQKISGGASNSTEPLSTAVLVSPQSSPPTPDVLSTTGTGEQGDRRDGGGIGGGNSGQGGVRSDGDRSLEGTDFDGNMVTNLETPVLVPRAPRVNAAVQSGELLPPPDNAIAKAAPDATTKRQLLTSVKTPIGAEEKGVAAVVGDSQEGERVGHDTENNSSKSKKKKSKKKKKKSGGGCTAGGCGDGGTGSGVGGGDGRGGGGGESGGTGWGMHRVSGFDAAKVGGGSQNDSALLIDEQSFSYIFTDRAAGVRDGGSGKSVAKTLIVGDQGFKPTKALVVQAGAVVSIKAASIRRSRGYGQDRALSISLEIPVARTLETQRFVEGTPRQTVLKKTNVFGEPLVAVFRKSGEYWLVDHLSGKRLKVTATERPEDLLQAGAAAAAEFRPSAAPGKGRKDGLASASSSLSRNADSCSSEGGKNAGGESVASSSRSKKKNKGKDKLAAATAITAAAAAALAANTVATSTKEALDRTEAAKLAAVPDIARGSEAPVGATAAPPPLPLLPPIRVMEGGDGLSLDELVEHNEAAKRSTLEGVHVVNVSHRRGFEPAMLEVGLTPGLGACIMCDLDFQQQVTREVVCRRLVCKGAGGSSANVMETSSAARGVRECSNPPGVTKDDEDAGKDAEEDEDAPNVKTARLGPGSLRKCHFILGQFGTYRLSYRNETNKGLSVVVRPPPLSVEGKKSARDGGMVRSPSAGDRNLRKDDVVKPPSLGEVEICGEDERQDSAAAVSSDNDIVAAKSGPTVTSVKPVEPPRERSADDSSSNLTLLEQWPSVGESSAVAAAVAAAAGGSFSLESTTDCDHGQGGFVHQRSQVKKKNKRLKRNSAAAAAAVAAASAKEAATKTATAATESVTGVAMGEPTGWDQAVVTALPPTGPSAATVPRDNSAAGVSRAAVTLSRQGKTQPAATYSQRTIAGDEGNTAMVAPVNRTFVQMPTSISRGADIPAKGSCAEADGLEAAASPGSAAVDMLDSVSTTGVDSGDVEHHDSGHRSTSPVTPAPAPAQEATQRVVGVGKLKTGELMRVDSSSRKMGGVTPKKCAPSVPTAATTVSAEKEEEQQEAAAPSAATGALAGTTGASGGRGPVTGGSWGGKKGERVRATSAGWNAPRATSPDGTLTRECQSRGASRPRRWDNPPAAVFTQSHPSPRNFQGIGEKGLGAPFVPGVDVLASGGGSVRAPRVSAQPRASGVEKGGRNPAHVGGEGPSGWGEPASIESPALLPPAAAAPGSVSSRTEPSYSCESITEPANSPCPPNGRSDAQQSLGATESTELRAAADKDTLPRPHSVPGQSAAMNAPSEKGNCTGRRDKTRADGSAWSSLKTGAMEDGRSRAAVSSSDPPDSKSERSTSSVSGSRVTASSSKLTKKQRKKAKVAERKAAERRAVVASAAEEPTRAPPGKPSALASSCLSEPSISSSRPQPSVAVPPVMVGACSSGVARGVGTGGDVRRASTSAAVHPGTSFGNSAPLGQVATVTHANESGAPATTSSSSKMHIPLAVPASRATGFDESSNDGGSIMRTSSLPGSSSGGLTNAWTGDSGEAEEKGVAASAKRTGHAASGSGGGVGPGRAPRGGLRRPPLAGLARSRSEADGGWGSAVSVATVVAVAPVPAAATLAQAEAQALPRPPPPGFGGEYLPAARARPCGDEEPAAATAMEGTISPAAISAHGPNTTSGLTSNSIGGDGVGCGGTQNAAQQGGRVFGNCSTKVSFEERSRRNQVLRAEATSFFPAAHAQSGRRGHRAVQAKPSAFPEESRLPGGGYYVEEGPDDTLPPPSAYEVQEAAYMMKVYDDMMERLRTTGMDETLPNGFTPRIYDFTNGGCC